MGEALDFDGAVDLIRMTNDIFFPSVTMEALIKPTLGTRNPIYDKYNYGIQLSESNQVGIWIRTDTEDGNQWPSVYTPFPTDGQWHHNDYMAVNEIGFAMIESSITGKTISIPCENRDRLIFANG